MEERWSELEARVERAEREARRARRTAALAVGLLICGGVFLYPRPAATQSGLTPDEEAQQAQRAVALARMPASSHVSIAAADGRAKKLKGPVQITGTGKAPIMAVDEIVVNSAILTRFRVLAANGAPLFMVVDTNEPGSTGAMAAIFHAPNRPSVILSGSSATGRITGMNLTGNTTFHIP